MGVFLELGPLPHAMSKDMSSVGKSDDEVIPRVSLMVTRRIYFRRLGLPRCLQPHFLLYTVAARLAGSEDQRAMFVPLELGYSPGNFDVVVCISQVHIK